MDEVTLQDVVDYLCKHFSEYNALECEVVDLRKQVNILWGEIVHRTGDLNLGNDWYGLDKRIRMLEEGEDGMRNFLTNSLKEKGRGGEEYVIK